MRRNITITLRKKCPYFPAFGLNTEKYLISPYPVRIQENTDQNTSEYGHFSRSARYETKQAPYPNPNYDTSEKIKFKLRDIIKL